MKTKCSFGEWAAYIGAFLAFFLAVFIIKTALHGASNLIDSGVTHERSRP